VRIRRPAPAPRATAGEAPEEVPDPDRRAAVLGRAGLAADALDDPNATIPHDAMCRIWSELTDEHADLAFGVRFADRVGMRALGVSGYLAASSATGSEAIQRVVAYHRLLKSAGEVSLLIEDGWLRVIEIPPAGARRWPRHLAETVLACYPSVAGRLSGVAVPAHEVRVQHPDPGSAARAEAERAFGCAICFDAPANEIVLPCDVLDTEVRTRDPHLSTHLEQLATRMLAELPEPDELLAAVRTAIAQGLPSGGVSLPMVARRLGYGERTCSAG
jgi:Arabinose-binding domain of AraC transcription regulator, N-term